MCEYCLLVSLTFSIGLFDPFKLAPVVLNQLFLFVLNTVSGLFLLNEFTIPLCAVLILGAL